MNFAFETVTVRYPTERIPALRNVSFKIESGETLLVTGQTGAGKTTLLRLLYLDLMPSEGRVFVGGQASDTIARRAYPALRRNMGLIFQDSKLLPNRTVYENVIYPLYAAKFGRRAADKRCLEVLADVGISFLRNKFPAQLSGGERHLVALARSIIHDPDVIIADEPSGNMDDATTEKVITVLGELAGKQRTVIVATHSPLVMSNFAGSRRFDITEGILKELATSPGPGG